MQQWIMFITMLSWKIYAGRMLGHAQLYGEQGIEWGGGIEDQRTTILRPLGLGSLGSAVFL